MNIQDVRRQRLREVIDGTRERSIAAFAAIVGKSATQLSDMLGSRKAFGEKVARDIERRARLAPMSLDLPHPAAVAPRETATGYLRFPLLEGYAGMGRGDYVGDYPEVVEFVEVAREWASQTLRGVPLEAIRVITGRGDSMRGVYNDGDLVFVDGRVKRFIGEAAYCFRRHGLVYIKRLQQLDETHVRILSANPDYPALDVPLVELEIGGRALAAWTLQPL